MAYLDCDWSTDDPSLEQTLREVDALPEDSAKRLAAVAALHMWKAQKCYERIGEIAARDGA